MKEKIYWITHDHQLSKLLGCFESLESIRVTKIVYSDPSGRIKPKKTRKYSNLGEMIDALKKELKSKGSGNTVVDILKSFYALFHYIGYMAKYSSEIKSKEYVIFEGKATQENLKLLDENSGYLSLSGTNLFFLRRGKAILYYLPHEPWAYALLSEKQAKTLGKTFEIQMHAEQMPLEEIARKTLGD